MKKVFLLLKSMHQIEGKPGKVMTAVAGKHGLELVPVEAKDIRVTFSMEGEDAIYVKGQKTEVPEAAFVYSNLTDYKTLRVLTMLESMGVRICNTADTIEKCADKLLAMQLIKKAGLSEEYGIRLPKTVLIDKTTTAEELQEALGLPMVIKVLDGYGGNGVTLHNDIESVKNTLSIIQAGELSCQVIAQEAILTSRGRDLRTQIINGKVVTCFERISDDGFRSNVHQGGRWIFLDAPEAVKAGALKIAEILGMQFGSVDFLYGAKEGEYYFCEANSMSGLDYVEDDEAIAGTITNEIIKALKGIR